MKKPYDKLMEEREAVKAVVPVGSVRSHRKNPDHHYIIKEIVIFEAEDVPMIIYTPQYIENSLSFARLATVFLEKVDTGNGAVQRFTRIM